ncbi:MAG: SlyX family protein [Pseudomonadota bacterium]
MEQRLIEIETKLAYTEDLVQQLNDIVTDQQTRMMKLERLCESLKERLQALGEDAPVDQSKHQPPPHY